MGHFYTCLIFLIQSLIISTKANDAENTGNNVLETTIPMRFYNSEWTDPFVRSEIIHNFTPYELSPSTTMMAYATDPKKSKEQQIEDIQCIANKIAQTIENEMTNLLSFAIVGYDKSTDDNKLNKRSIETPMDSTKLVTRLLNHIKNNNENQNIAIEKFMSAKEIADKYKIEFEPETDLLEDILDAAGKQSEQSDSTAKDACKQNTKEVFTFVPLEEKSEQTKPVDNRKNSTFFEYTIYCPGDDIFNNLYPPFEFKPEKINNARPDGSNKPKIKSRCNCNPCRCENQIPRPPVRCNCAGVSKPKTTTPIPDFYPYCSVESVSSIIIPEELVEPTPEVVGEEYEETISSKVIVENGDEPGSGTVNNVMTYTLAEKTHYKTPQDNLPEHLQYCFMMM